MPRGLGFRACQSHSVASQHGCSICSKTYNFAFCFHRRSKYNNRSKPRKPCTRISDHSPCPEGTHQSSSLRLLCYIKSADEHNGKPSNVLFGRGSDDSVATPHSGGVRKYCMSNVLFGRGSNHFNALFGRGFGEYIVTLVQLRKGCMRQACSAPDTFCSYPCPQGEEICNLHCPPQHRRRERSRPPSSRIKRLCLTGPCA